MTAEGTTEGVRGIDAARVDAWLEGHVAGTAAPFAYRLVAGGRSNLTFEVRDAGGRRMVLRRPPLGNVLPSAHDVAREHRIVSALHGTPVPVAAPLALCEDTAVTGAPFAVFDFVDGVVLRSEEDAERELTPEARAAAGCALADVLADLHAVDPDAVGLSTEGRREGYAQRQLHRWHTQVQRTKVRELPALDEVHRRLSASVPPQRRTSIAHGDFRIDNCMLGPDGAVRAVLDWELCTIGDPLADLGLLLVYWVDPGDDPASVLTGTATRAPGFPERAALADRYAARSGADLSDLPFYVALGLWKLACIFEGIRARYGAGVMGDDTMSAQDAAAHVEALAEAALDASACLHGSGS